MPALPARRRRLGSQRWQGRRSRQTPNPGMTTFMHRVTDTTFAPEIGSGAGQGRPYEGPVALRAGSNACRMRRATTILCTSSGPS